MQKKGIFLLFARSRTDDFRHLISVTAERQDAPARRIRTVGEEEEGDLFRE